MGRIGRVKWRDISGDYYDWRITKEPEVPYIHDYSQTMTMKMFCSIPDNKDNSIIGATFSDVLERIKIIDQLSRGIPKIIYLVGWQFQGHDDKYPSWNVVNDALKRPEDKNGLESLLWLMEEGYKHDTTVSLHINMTDAYKDSPLWNTYVANDLISKKENGDFLETGQWNGRMAYQVCYKKEWESGYAVKRINDLLELLPVRRAGTIHIDAFFARESKGHGIRIEDEQIFRRKIIRYWRQQGVDVTSEFIYRETGVDDLIGLVPFVWWINQEEQDYLERPANLLTGGRINPDLIQEDEQLEILFGESIHGEDLPFKDSHWEMEFLKECCLTYLPWYFLNQHPRKKVEKNNNGKGMAYFSNEVVSSIEGKKITQDKRIIKDGNDILIQASWRELDEWVAYSLKGYRNKAWILPKDYEQYHHAKLYQLTPKGTVPLETVEIKHCTVVLSMKPGSAIVVVPMP